MSKLEFAIWDSHGADEMARSPEAADVYERHIRQVQMEEQLGYRYYFVIEHQNGLNSQITAPSLYLGVVAQHTSTIRIGTMIYQLPFHHPQRLAEEAAMLDHLSRGRLDFGAGNGILEHEFIRWNLPYSERREMGVEALEIILKSWTEDVVTYNGKYWQLNEALPAPKPYQKPHPPIWIAAHTPTSMDYAAKNNWNVSQNLDVDEVIAEKFEFFQQTWKQYGHEGPMPHRLLMRPIHVAETDEIARAEAEPHMMAATNPGLEKIAQTRVGMVAFSDLTHRGPEARGTPSSLRSAPSGSAKFRQAPWVCRQGWALTCNCSTPLSWAA